MPRHWKGKANHKIPNKETVMENKKEMELE
jgi:hypothetical protein